MIGDELAGGSTGQAVISLLGNHRSPILFDFTRIFLFAVPVLALWLRRFRFRWFERALRGSLSRQTRFALLERLCETFLLLLPL